MNNFLDIINLTKTRCNITDVNDYDTLIKEAINQAYIELKKDDPTIAITFLTPVNGSMVLPDDYDGIVSIEPSLNPGWSQIGKYIITTQEDSFEVKYKTVVEPLSNNNDEPDLNKKYWYTLSTYACYAYYLSKKKIQESNAFYNEYLTAVKKLKPQDIIQSLTENVYQDMWLER